MMGSGLPSPFYTEMRRRLRELRVTNGLSLEDVAAAGDGEWTIATVGSYERASRRAYPHTLVGLADFYTVPVTAIIPGTEISGVAVTDLLRVLRLEEDLHADCARLLRAVERSARRDQATLSRLLQEGAGHG